MSATDAEPADLPAPPDGVAVDYAQSGDIFVTVRISPTSRVLMALPRIALLALSIAVLVVAWLHRVFVFWFIGLPFLRWLRSPAQSSLRIGERELELGAAGIFRAPLLLARSSITAFELGHAGITRLYQPALLARHVDKRTTLLMAGLSRSQAEFLRDGLQRWLDQD